MILRHLIAAALVLLPFIASGQPATSVSTLADLAAFPGRSNEVVRVRGFYSRDDWGKPRDYVWDPTSTAATNAITIQRWASGSPIATGRWIHNWDGDVQVFGMVADFDTATQTGTDNADRLESALTYAAGQSGLNRNHRKVFAPAGNYYFSRGIGIPSLAGSDGGADTQHLLLEGEWDHSTVFYFDGTNNAITISGTMASLKNLLITSTTNRQAQVITDDTYGNGVFMSDPVDGFTARFVLDNLRISEQPGHGLVLYGGIELLNAQNIWAHSNGRNGFHLEKNDAFVAEPNRNFFLNCRATSNGQFGWYVEGLDNVFVTPEGINNAGGVQFYLGNPNRGNIIVNPDMEFITDLTATASHTFTNSLTFTVAVGDDFIWNSEGYDFAGNGWVTNQFVQVIGSALNDGVYKVVGVTSTNLVVNTALLQPIVAESATNASVKLTMVPSGVGMVINGGRHNQVIGGFIGSVAAGIYLHSSPDNVIQSIEAANYSADYGQIYAVRLGTTASINNKVWLPAYSAIGLSNKWTTVSGATNYVMVGSRIESVLQPSTIHARTTESTVARFERTSTFDQLSLSFNGSRPTWVTQSGDPVMLFTDSTASSANKSMSIGTYPYGSFSGTWVEGFTLSAQSGANLLSIGGGSSSGYDATAIRFYGTTNVTTTGGQEMARLSPLNSTNQTTLQLSVGTNALRRVSILSTNGHDFLVLEP